MEASLIGKALVFGSKECRFEPCVSKVYYNTNSYVSNHFNILNSKKMPRVTITFTKKSHSVVKLLYSMRIIQGYMLVYKNNTKFIVFNSYHYRGVPYFTHFKLISTSSKPCSISLKALKTVNKSIGNSIIILETDKGIVSHEDAISYKIGGRLLGVIS